VFSAQNFNSSEASGLDPFFRKNFVSVSTDMYGELFRSEYTLTMSKKLKFCAIGYLSADLRHNFTATMRIKAGEGADKAPDWGVVLNSAVHCLA
jgi:hypothetical protein